MRLHKPSAISDKIGGFTPTPQRKSVNPEGINFRLVWGFTLIEMVIFMGIAAIIFSIGLPVSWNFYLDYQLIYEQRTLNSLLGYARNLSMVNVNEKPWVIKDDEGREVYSLLPAAVVVSLIKQLPAALGL